MGRHLPWLFGVVLGLAVGLGILLGRVVLDGPRVHAEPEREDARAARDPVQADQENAIVRAVRAVSPSVVSLTSVRIGPAPQTVAELFDFWRRGGQRSEIGLGSGLIIDAGGLILTNHHVVDGATQLRVTLQDGQSFEAEIVGSHADTDLAVIRLKGEARGLPVAPLGDSDRLRNGEWAIAIGTPFGEYIDDSASSVTVGVISAVHRDMKGGRDKRLYYDLIQTDAAINPGNSGGPLVNARGQVVGINSAILTNSAGVATGLGFAVPINRARWVLDEIRAYGRVRPYDIGLKGQAFGAENRERLGIAPEVPPGWLVREVVPGSPGDRAGLQPQDIIVAVNGVALESDEARRRSLYDARVGQTIRLAIWRQGRSFEVSVTLAEAPDDRR